MVSGILEQDHERLSDLLHELRSGLQHHELAGWFALLDLFWARLAVHIRAENLCLFPAVLNAPRELFGHCAGVPGIEEATKTIDSLRSDHNFFMDELARAVKACREILANPQSDLHVAAQLEMVRARVAAVSLRLESHNALEETQVYNWPVAILNAADLETLRNEIRRELENLPGRFTSL